ncbi:serine/threonine-protein kinase LMTK2-like isoform X2 [Anneissia japonica]|uniref:serine/threonine-protein kinase LMTK2-like isoform X2 n=1 Tax=Anneissia japonica TaxID=1529436 RepID=UPI001425AADA|nr:serine/threonine-protein kinase LMTK2-like isoform X2 [Anneissia japonica]
MEDLLELPAVLTVATLVVLIIVLFGCGRCFRFLFPKPDELGIVHQDESGIENNDNFGDFRPPSQNTPYNDPVDVEPLPDASHLRLGQHVSSLSPAQSGPSLAQENIKFLNDPSMQFPRTQLSYVDELGNGWFGKVLQGEARKIQVGIKKTKVVVKELKDTATREEQIRFLREVQSHRELRHPNMLSLLGQCIDSIPFLLIMEHAPLGDLKSYLMKHREEMQSMALRDVQLKLACDLASGLTLLHQAGFVHMDFAARNCLLASVDSLKIGDYGLSQEKYKGDYYRLPSTNQIVPIRWLPPDGFEVNGPIVKPKAITKESNVWSFGVVLWELSTGALLPYSNCNDEEVVRDVIIQQHTKIEPPQLQVKYIGRWWEIMQLCWQSHEKSPTMQHILELLTHLKSHKDKSDREEFQEKWDSLKSSDSAALNGSVLATHPASSGHSQDSSLGQLLQTSEGVTLTSASATTSDTDVVGIMMHPALTNPLTSSIVTVEHHAPLMSPGVQAAVSTASDSSSTFTAENTTLIDVNTSNEQILQTPESNDLLNSYSNDIQVSADLLKTPPNTPIEEGFLSRASDSENLQSSAAAQILSEGLETLDARAGHVGLPQSPEHIDSLATIQQLNNVMATNFTSLSPMVTTVNGATSPAGVSSPAGAGDVKVLEINIGDDGRLINGTEGKPVKEGEENGKLLQDDASEVFLHDGRPRKSSLRYSSNKTIEDGTTKSVKFEDDPSLTSVYNYPTEPTSPINSSFTDEFSIAVASTIKYPETEEVTETAVRPDGIEMLNPQGKADELSSEGVQGVKKDVDDGMKVEGSVSNERLSDSGDTNGADNLMPQMI